MWYQVEGERWRGSARATLLGSLLPGIKTQGLALTHFLPPTPAPSSPVSPPPWLLEPLQQPLCLHPQSRGVFVKDKVIPCLKPSMAPACWQEKASAHLTPTILCDLQFPEWAQPFSSLSLSSCCSFNQESTHTFHIYLLK